MQPMSIILLIKFGENLLLLYADLLDMMCLLLVIVTSDLGKLEWYATCLNACFTTAITFLVDVTVSKRFSGTFAGKLVYSHPYNAVQGLQFMVVNMIEGYHRGNKPRS